MVAAVGTVTLSRSPGRVDPARFGTCAGDPPVCSLGGGHQGGGLAGERVVPECSPYGTGRAARWKAPRRPLENRCWELGEEKSGHLARA